MAVAQAQAESPGLSRFILPILGLIGLGLCGGGILVLYDPQGGPILRLDLRRHREHAPARPTCATVRATR